MERSAAEFSLDEPTGATREIAPVVGAFSSEKAISGERGLQRNAIEEGSANPFRDEPPPVVVDAVKRFGLVGLVVCAVGTGLVRWWHSKTDRLQ